MTVGLVAVGVANHFVLARTRCSSIPRRDAGRRSLLYWIGLAGGQLMPRSSGAALERLAAAAGERGHGDLDARFGTAFPQAVADRTTADAEATDQAAGSGRT